MAYLAPPNRRRWRGEIRAALGKHRSSWRYRYAVAVGLTAAGAKRLIELPEGVVVKQLH